MQIENDAKAVEYETSAFWGHSLLIINELGLSDLYMQVKEFLEKKLEQVTKCARFLRKEDELFLYDSYTMNRAGEGIEIRVEDDFETFSNMVNYIMQQYKDEILSFDEYSFSSLEMFICHYYEYIPRVKFEL